MKTAGGIIALIAGIFGIIGAAITLLGCSFSGVFGWQGVTFSFIVIVLGAVALRVDRKMVGVLLIIIPLVGALLEYVLVDDSCGGPHQINAFVTGLGMMIVAVFMVLASIGGIFVTIGAGRKKSGNETVKVLIIVGLVFLDFCLILYIIGLTFGILS